MRNTNLVIIAIAVFLISGLHVYSQPIGIKQIGNNGGEFEDVCYQNGRAVGVSNAWQKEIICLNQNLNVIWADTFSNASPITLGKIVMTKDSGIVCIGSTYDNSGSSFVCKLDKSGNLLFQREYLLTGQQLEIFSISAAGGNDTGFILGGGSCSTPNFLIKCDQNGNIEWAFSYNYFGPDVRDIYANNSGYTIASYKYAGNFDPIIWNTDLNGNLNWFKLMQTDIPDIPVKLNRLSNGKFAMLCQDDYNETGYTIAIADSSFNSINYKIFSSSDIVRIADIVEDSAGSCLGVGYSLTTATPAVYSAVYIKVDSALNVLWRKNTIIPGVTGIPYANTITKMPSGNFMGAGAMKIITVIDNRGLGHCYEEPSNLSTLTQTFSLVSINPSITVINPTSINTNFGFGRSTYAETGLCGPLDVKETAIYKPINIYPNPCNGNFKVNIESNIDNGKVILFDMLGQSIFEKRLINGVNEINASDISKGLYNYFILVDNRKFASGKISID